MLAAIGLAGLVILVMYFLWSVAGHISNANWGD